ncbi:MAG: acyl-CoA thioesterase [Bacteroidota bacterium]
METFNTSLTLRIDWSELDLFGHVNNVEFFKYIQASRVNYWDSIGLTYLFTESKLGPMLASTECQFKKPLFYPGEITVLAKVDFIKNSSFGLTHAIVDQHGDVAATGKDIVVYYDYNNHHKLALPDYIRERIYQREQKRF